MSVAITKDQSGLWRPIEQAQAAAQAGSGFPGDGESEPAASAVGPQRAIKGVEHPCALGGRDAGAVVEDIDDRRACVRREAHRDLAA